MTLVDEFLKHAANRPEQRFWIGRTYDYMQFYSDKETIRLWGALNHYRLPRKIRDVLHLKTVAKLWRFETTRNRSPNKEEMLELMKEGKND